MTWGAIGAAAVSTIGGAVLGGKGQKQTSTSEPWSGQQPFLRHGFNQAQTSLDNSLAMGTYSGPRVAGLNPYQTQGYDGAATFAKNQGMGAAQGLYGVGMDTLGSGKQFAQNAGSLFHQVSQDPTQDILRGAGAYANNPYMDGMIDAASRDVVRNFREQQLPGIDHSAAATGNMNSSRTGVVEGIAYRGAQDRIGDISATLRGQAFSQGLGLAQTQHNSNVGHQFDANGQLLYAGNFGRLTTDAGLNAGYSSMDALTRAGAGYQSYDQQVLNGQMADFHDRQNNGLDLVGKYMQTIGGSYGGTQTTTTPGNTLQGALTGFLGGAGLYGKMSGGFTPY